MKKESDPFAIPEVTWNGDNFNEVKSFVSKKYDLVHGQGNFLILISHKGNHIVKKGATIRKKSLKADLVEVIQ